MGAWAAVSFSDGSVRGLRHSGTSEVLRLPGVVEGSQYLISAAAAILGDAFLSRKFSSQLPRVTSGKEGGREAHWPLCSK